MQIVKMHMNIKISAPAVNLLTSTMPLPCTDTSHKLQAVMILCLDFMHSWANAATVAIIINCVMLDC